MKFFGTPNMLIKERTRKPMSTEIVMKPIFRFDANGEYETNDPKLIEKLKRKFRFEEEKETKTFKCKQCDYETDNKGLLLAHYRDHKKE